MDWEINGLTGTEIYNTHADFSEEDKLIAKLKNPLGMFQLMERFQKYPQEAFGALQDYPAGYLKKWDELCGQKPCTCGLKRWRDPPNHPDNLMTMGVDVGVLAGDKTALTR